MKNGWARVKAIDSKRNIPEELQVLLQYEQLAQSKNLGIWSNAAHAPRNLLNTFEGDARELIQKYKQTPIPGISF